MFQPTKKTVLQLVQIIGDKLQSQKQHPEIEKMKTKKITTAAKQENKSRRRGRRRRRRRRRRRSRRRRRRNRRNSDGLDEFSIFFSVMQFTETNHRQKLTNLPT